MNTTTKEVIINKWSDYLFKIDTEATLHLSQLNIVTENKISLAVEYFKELLFINSNITFKEKSNSDYKLLIIFKIKTINNQFRSISYMQIIRLDEIDILKNIFIEFWSLKTEDYYLAKISYIIFTYKIVSASGLERKNFKSNESCLSYEPSLDTRDVQNKEIINSDAYLPTTTTPTPTEINKMSFGGHNLPATMDIEIWGDVQFISETKAIVYKKGSNREYHVEYFFNNTERYQTVELKLEDNTLLSFKDILNDKSNLSTFTRIVNKNEYIFEEGKLLVKKIIKSVEFLTKIKRSMKNSKNILTMDLETRTINEVMSSYCVSIYDGKTTKSFYLSDYSGDTAENDMLKASILYIMKRKYHNHRVYLHNFSKFDAVFLLRVMTDLCEHIKPTLRNGQFLNLKLTFAKKYNLFFRDSLLLLPGSLRSLAKNFDVENKGLFPYRFVNNINIPLNYIGPAPDILFFDGISQEEYNLYLSNLNYNGNNWDLRKETIKYCKLDCIVLYKIIDKFSDNIFKLFRINVLKYPTLSSLAFAIYRTKFLNDKTQIPLIHGVIYDFIKHSYTGGSVDVYKPTPPLDSEGKPKKIYRYDVNSLYPYVMKSYPMPVGYPTYFEGDILKSYVSGDKPFGIFEADIMAPSDIKIPLLQTRVKVKKGTTRTVAPIGNWTGHYFSDELYNAAKHGYTFKVKRGYLFERGNIFSEYVDFLFKLKQNSEKGTPNYMISKLLLNSLYGRLGMNPITENHVIISSDKGKDFYSKFNITNILDLKNGKELISFFDLNLNDDESHYNIKNISVVVSSVVTASARIHMSKFKTDKRFIICYTDTDSIDIDEMLDSNLIGTDLGLMKLEHIFIDVVFLSPKMYGGITDSYEYTRIKGLKNPLKFEELKALLNKDTKLEVKQEKWYSDISNGQFHIKDEIYTLMTTDNKRKLLYNSENKFYDTLPLKIVNSQIVY